MNLTGIKKRAIIVHLNGLAGVAPLVGGYLKAYAYGDQEVRANWDIELYSASSQSKASHVIRHLVAGDPDLVAFSVYTWNAGLVGRILPALRGLLPRARFLLGGTEVANVGPHYVNRTWDNVLVCNGEGEKSFRALLLELGTPTPDFERVGGLSFPRDGEWLTTPGQARIEDLTELPSPWLSGVFDDIDLGEVALYESNRGCPFACEFCYWGGAIGQKVYRQDMERIKDEITYIGKRGVRTLSFCDANFGILPRDVEIARHVVEVCRTYKGPNRVVYNSSKVHPERVEEISNLFSQNGLLTRHVFSLQTMDATALRRAKRTGLDRASYRDIQKRLNARRMSSLIELLWPMPGETLETFRAGVDELLESGAQTFLAYPLVWLNNTGYHDNTLEYGVETLLEDDPAGSGRLVVKTSEVSFEEYLAGLRHIVALYLLHDCRGLYGTMQLLNALGIARFQDVLTAFADWMESEAEGAVADAWRAQLDCFEDLAKYTWRGILADVVLNADRADFDRLLVRFTRSQEAWFEGEHGDLLRAAIDFDLLTRPYAFLQTPFELGADLERIRLEESRARYRLVRAPYDFPRLLDDLRVGVAPTAATLAPGDFPIEIDHRGHQLFLMPSRSVSAHQWLCTLATQEIARIEPKCRVLRVEQEAG